MEDLFKQCWHVWRYFKAAFKSIYSYVAARGDTAGGLDADYTPINVMPEGKGGGDHGIGWGL